ncbi:hypothetical protein FNV43_RR16948 [Rhamnella rubrinervis]|uniref:Uncharacterized protein n=1 Tax=Rhamnella rubrinervis TaxID=2594499 RepID=A0A8K0GZN6_9ROSA|nr:hypothetical protein FNV43_RR16948 [Rhamnella rubrinervis]
MSSFQQLLEQLVSLLGSLQSCWSAGSKEKFGFDEAFNNKEEPDLDAALKRNRHLLRECLGKDARYGATQHEDPWKNCYLWDDIAYSKTLRSLKEFIICISFSKRVRIRIQGLIISDRYHFY